MQIYFRYPFLKLSSCFFFFKQDVQIFKIDYIRKRINAHNYMLNRSKTVVMLTELFRFIYLQADRVPFFLLLIKFRF